MATKKKPDIIPEVDILKSGLKRFNPNDGLEITENGLVVISRNKAGRESKERYIVSEMNEYEKKLKEFKKEAEKLNLTKKDISNISNDIKKDKKKKKKKDKNKYKDSYMNSLIDAVPKDLSDYIRDGGEEGLKKKKKKDKKKKKKNQIEGLIIKEKKKKPEKEKNNKSKSTSEVAERFKEVEKITRENIQEIDNTLKIIDDRIKEMTKSSERVRGRDKALADYITAKTSLISSRQKAATDILSNRAKVYDIEMKKEKSATSNAASDADIIARIFPGIAMNGSMDTSIKSHIASTGKNADGKKKKKKGSKKGGGLIYDDDVDLLTKREKELIKSGDIEYSDYDKNIEWEGQFDTAIMKSWTDGQWKFIAVDNDGNIIKGVPKSMLPSKKTVQMKFDDEKDVAIDVNSNRAFQVIQVPQI